MERIMSNHQSTEHSDSSHHDHGVLDKPSNGFSTSHVTVDSTSNKASAPSSLEQSLLPSHDGSHITNWRLMMSLIKLGVPGAGQCLIQNLIQLSSTLFVGRLGTTAIGGATMGNMLCNLFGYSIGIGFCTALDALCSQAYGARQFQLVGLHAQRGAVMITLACLPIALVWSQTESIVIMMGIDPAIASLAAVYSNYMIIGMWPMLQVDCLKRWLTSQRTVWPNVAASVVTIFGSIGMNLMFQDWNWGFEGAALAAALSYWVMFLTMLLCSVMRQRYIKQRERARATALLNSQSINRAGLSSQSLDVSLNINQSINQSIQDSDEAAEAELDDIHDCWPKLSKAIFTGWGPQLKLGIPGAASLFVEWGSYEVSATFAGQLGELPLACHGIYMATATLLYGGCLGVSNSTAAIIGNYLGGNQSMLAKRTAKIGIQLGLAWGVGIYALLVFILRPYWGTIFTNVVEVQEKVADWMWPLLLYGIFDSIKSVCMACLRGSGRPTVTVVGNIVSCYFIGFPLSWLFVITLEWGLEALWVAMAISWISATIIYCAVLLRTNWQAECLKASARTNASLPIHVEEPAIELEETSVKSSN